MNIMETKDARAEKPENLAMLADRQYRRNLIGGPRVGDYLKITRPNGKIEYTRFTYLWDEMEPQFEDKMQTGGNTYSQYYLHRNGYCDYSGGLNPGILVKHLVRTDEIRSGKVWFFDDDHARAGGGVEYMIENRVFTHTQDADLSGIY